MSNRTEADYSPGPVPYVVNKRIGRYLRTQRKNMLRFFQERGLFDLASRMTQIRNSRQGMLAKNKMFQEVLNSYAAQTMPAQPGVLEPKAEQVQNVRQDSVSSVAEGEPGESGVEVNSVAEGEPRKATSDPEQALRVPNPDQTDTENL
jgi:hypothetical protein